MRPLWIAAIALGCLALVAYEVGTSSIQAMLFSRLARSLTYAIAPGPSGRIAFPRSGPFDERRGYSRLPEFQRRLEVHGYRITEQARQSPATALAVGWGITAPYPEPSTTGLIVRDGRERVLHAAPAPPVFRNHDDVPPLLVRSLVFLENRGLAFEPARSNPAVDWARLGKATLSYLGHGLGLPVRVEGGSTLATQLQKYRHSPEGRTTSALDKLRQMTAASLRAYRGGADTRDERRQIVVDYLNTMPLAAAPQYGDVHGLGEGLRVWFGRDLEETARALRSPVVGPAKAVAFKHVLALLYAVRAPSRYLVDARRPLEARVDAVAGLLAAAGAIDTDLARLVRETPLMFRSATHRPLPAFVERKAANALRDHVTRLLALPGPYELQRLDLEVETTFDAPLQTAVTGVLKALADPRFVRAQGLDELRMLSRGDPGRVVWSLLLVERTAEGNAVRVQADSLEAPLDVNGGMKLELGSTAKLRTLAHYLQIAAELHDDWRRLDPVSVARRAETARDPITRWAAATLRAEPGMALEAFLDRALERTYSASPYEVFFTGGGSHTFENFDPEDDDRVPTVRDALVRSTNLVFVRVMRDLARFHEARLPYDAPAVLGDPDHPERVRLLAEIADEEARARLARTYRDYRGLGADARLARLLRDHEPSLRHLAIVFFAWHHGADAAALGRWLAARGRHVETNEAERLFRAYGNSRLGLADYGYLLGRHPLEVWGAGELARSPHLSWSELSSRSGEARRVASAWLFERRHRRAQDVRLRARIERDAFARMTPDWRRLGFPFAQLVPSYATAIGSSADRPAALAELMGIIVNDGVRRPTRIVTRLRFARDTPYHTVFEPRATSGERVLPAAVARALRAVLAETVERGTARRLEGAFAGPGGASITVGAKTGSGDNRFETFAADGAVKSSRSVSRTGAVAFHVGDRYFGVITASVAGAAAADYGFTSALPLAALRLIAPKINERLVETRAEMP
ncbi:MAG: transglycosylase domain-containing protein [Candidatus Rokubacteria bacterium]|nr:transglycosylase domain-containing protein [Candidatus Rokubacteria bacterium]